ncbi:MAG: hypothetical protein R3E76_15890 [Planctomycetota bacterium]
MKRISFTFALLLVFALVAACPQDTEWTPEQKGVHQAMMDWSGAVTKRDAEAMWEMISPDAQEIYRRELEAPGGAKQTVKLTQASLEPGSLISAKRRKELEELLASLPKNVEKMTPKDYYVWRMTPELTSENALNTERLLAKDNVSSISIDGDRATVELKNGDPDRYSWVRHDGVWKFDLKPSILRALETARQLETQNK